MSPEEYVARHAHALGNFAFHIYRYRDEILGDWVREVGKILADDQVVEKCRERFLSADEQAMVRRQHLEDL